MVTVADDGSEVEFLEADLFRHTEFRRGSPAHGESHKRRANCHAPVLLGPRLNAERYCDIEIFDRSAPLSSRTKKCARLVQRQSVWDICERNSAAKKKSTQTAPKRQI